AVGRPRGRIGVGEAIAGKVEFAAGDDVHDVEGDLSLVAGFVEVDRAGEGDPGAVGTPARPGEGHHALGEGAQIAAVEGDHGEGAVEGRSVGVALDEGDPGACRVPGRPARVHPRGDGAFVAVGGGDVNDAVACVHERRVPAAHGGEVGSDALIGRIVGG